MTQLTIKNFESSEPAMLADVTERVRSWGCIAEATIYCSARRKSEWCEYMLVAGTLTMGCIQRSIGAETEFHS